jgi:hypothetical protein
MIDKYFFPGQRMTFFILSSSWIFLSRSICYDPFNDRFKVSVPSRPHVLGRHRNHNVSRTGAVGGSFLSQS